MWNSKLLRFALVLALFAGFSVPASADSITADPITILLPLDQSHFSRALAINDSGWIVGYQESIVSADVEGMLWVPTNELFTLGTMIGNPFVEQDWEAVDIHDNGDVLMDTNISGTHAPTCTNPPCLLGGSYVVAHLEGGATLSGHDYTATAGFNPPGGGLDFNFEDEWLSSLSLWGPIQPRTSNQLGETIHNFGNPSDCVNFTGLGCVAFARTVPEPASIWLLLGLLGVIGLLRVGKRRKLLRPNGEMCQSSAA